MGGGGVWAWVNLSLPVRMEGGEGCGVERGV